MTVGELIVELGFNADQTKLNDFVRSLGELNMSSIMASVGIGGLYEGIRKILDQATDTAMGMHIFGVQTGISEQKMKSWSNLAEQAGVKGDALMQTLEHMQMVQAKAKMGVIDDGVIQGLSILNQYGHAGVKLYEDVFTQQDKIRKGLAALDDGQKRNVLSLLGINEQMLLFYKLTDDVYAKRNDQSMVGNKAEVEDLARLWASMKETGQDFAKILLQMGQGLANWVTPMVEFAGHMTEAISKSRTLQGIILSIAFAISAATGNLAGVIASGGALVTWAYANNEKLGSMIGKGASAMGTGPMGAYGIPPELAQAMNAQPVSQTKTVTVTNHITGDNPHAIAQEVKKIVQEQLDETHYQSPLRQF